MSKSPIHQPQTADARKSQTDSTDRGTGRCEIHRRHGVKPQRVPSNEFHKALDVCRVSARTASARQGRHEDLKEVRRLAANNPEMMETGDKRLRLHPMP